MYTWPEIKFRLVWLLKATNGTVRATHMHLVSNSLTFTWNVCLSVNTKCNERDAGISLSLLQCKSA